MATTRILDGVIGRRLLIVGSGVLAISFAASLAVALADDTRTGPDRSLFELVIDNRGQFLIDVARSVVVLGEVFPLALLALLCAGSMLLRGVEPLRASVPLVSLVVVAPVVWALKQAVGRQGPSQVMRRVIEPSGSFPSGHAALCAAVLVAVGLVFTVDAGAPTFVRRVVFAACAVIAAMVSWSTVVLHMHWPADAIGGSILGAAVAVGLCAMVDRRLTRAGPSAVGGSADGT